MSSWGELFALTDYHSVACPHCGMPIWGTDSDIDSGLRHHVDYCIYNPENGEATMSDGKLVSPNDMLQAAKEYMLDNADPASFEDWVKVINFVAYNSAAGLEAEICTLMVVLYDIPLEAIDVIQIVEFQSAIKAGQNAE